MIDASALAQGLSRVRDGLLVTEIDLNLCRQVKDKWGFQVILLQVAHHLLANQAVFSDEPTPRHVQRRDVANCRKLSFG